MTPRPARQNLLRPAAPGSPVAFSGHGVHAHDHPLLIHVVSGSVVIEIHRRGGGEPTRIAAEAGTGVWLATGIGHAVTSQRESILIGPRLSESTQPPADFLPLFGVAEIHELALLILASAPRTEDEKHRFRTALDSLLGDLAVDAFPVPEASDPIIRTITADPLSLFLPLTDLARVHALSPRHIERLFRQDLGLSYVGWRTRERLNHAVRRIRAGASHRAAARAVGYDSADGLVKAAQRQTRLDRAELSADFAAAIDAWSTSAAQLSGSHSSPSSTR